VLKGEITMPMISFSARVSRLIERFVDAVEIIATEIKRDNDLKTLEIGGVLPQNEDEGE